MKVAVLGVGTAGIMLLPTLISGFEALAAGVALLGIGLGPITLAILGITAAIAAGIIIWKTYGYQISSVFDKFKSGDW